VSALALAACGGDDDGGDPTAENEALHHRRIRRPSTPSGKDR
jgi:hypothetical protein